MTATSEVQQAIVQDYEAGDPVRVIATRHGVGIGAVTTLATTAGIRRRDSPRARGVGYPCGACRHNRVPAPDALCDVCADEVPLTGGQWVKDRRGILRYVLEDAS